jgi:hypothetical protein
VTARFAAGARSFRIRRAVESWASANDLRDTPVAILLTAALERADALGRDLFASELHDACTAAVEAHAREVAEAERVRRAKEERDAALERDRLAYLARVQADLVAQRGGGGHRDH